MKAKGNWVKVGNVMLAKLQVKNQSAMKSVTAEKEAVNVNETQWN